MYSKDKTDKFWMQHAIALAEQAKDDNEVPVGAIVVLAGEIIGKARNNTIKNSDPSGHAEINALRSAAKLVMNHRLIGATLFVTLEPCAMCYGAIVQSRISRLVFGAYDHKTGVCGSSSNLHEQACFNHTPNIKGGVLEEDCSLILKNFFKERRN